MPNVNIEDKLYDDIRAYCRLNKLTISTFINDLLKKTFMVEKYNDAPPFFKKKEYEEIKSVIIKNFEPEKFRQEFLCDPEPIKRKKYVKPEVLSIEERDIEEKLTAKEKARLRTKYL